MSFYSTVPFSSTGGTFTDVMATVPGQMQTASSPGRPDHNFVGTDHEFLSGDPPPYREDIRLVPMTAAESTRRDRSWLRGKGWIKYIAIPSVTSSTTTPPPGWIEFAHPKGPKYFHHTTRRVTTNSNIRNPQKLEVLYCALQLLDTRLNNQNLILPITTEVTLEVDIKRNPPVVKYYYVDHIQKSEFWLEETCTESLKCPPVRSYTQLKCLFRQHYWMHIEFYPMHFNLSIEDKDELVAVLTHACVDRMTSPDSAVPYNKDQCEAHLSLIRSLPDSNNAEGRRNIVLARIWFEIDRHFFVNL